MGTTTIRVDEEVRNKINELIKSEEWGSQDNALSQLIAIYELENAKISIPERRTEIESVQSHIQAVLDIYTMSLQLNQDAEERIKQKFANKLESNQETIQGLQGEKNKLAEALEKLSDVNKEITETVTEQKKEVEQLRKELVKTEKLCEEYRGKNDTLAGLLTEYKTYKGRNEELSRSMDLLADKLKEFTNKLSEQEQQHKTAIIELKEIHSEEMKEVKGQLVELEQQSKGQLAELEQKSKMGMLELKNEHSETIRELSNKHNKEIEETNKEYKKLLNELEELRKENYKLEKKLMQQHPDAEPADVVPEEKAVKSRSRARKKDEPKPEENPKV